MASFAGKLAAVVLLAFGLVLWLRLPLAAENRGKDIRHGATASSTLDPSPTDAEPASTSNASNGEPSALEGLATRSPQDVSFTISDDASRLAATVAHARNFNVTLRTLRDALELAERNFFAAEVDSFQPTSDGDFVCILNTSAPFVPGKRKKKRRYLQTCSHKAPPNDAAPTANRSFIYHPQPVTSLQPASVAVCISGQQRRLQAVGPAMQKHLMVPNRGKIHAYAATWPIPDDDGVTADSMKYAADQIARQISPLVAVRVEQFNPIGLRRIEMFTARTTAPFMFFMMEACARLVVASPFQYEFFIRLRFDVTLRGPIVFFPTHPPTLKATATNSTGNSTRSEWKVQIGQFAPLVIPSETLLFNDYTKCCVNDWIHAGPVQQMLQLSFLYSFLQQQPVTPGDESAPYRRPWCTTPEQCMALAMRNSGLRWQNAAFLVVLGSESPRLEVAPNCVGACKYAN